MFTIPKCRVKGAKFVGNKHTNRSHYWFSVSNPASGQLLYRDWSSEFETLSKNNF